MDDTTVIATEGMFLLLKPILLRMVCSYNTVATQR